MAPHNVQQMMGHGFICPPPGLEPPAGHTNYDVLNSSVTKPKLQPPPGKFIMKPPPGVFDVNCKGPPGKFTKPSASSQLVPSPPPGCLDLAKQVHWAGQLTRPPGIWDSISLTSTGVGDDASVLSIGTLPEFIYDEEIEAEPKPKRVSFGSTDTVLYEVEEAFCCNAETEERLSECEKHKTHLGSQGHWAMEEPILIQWQVDVKKLKSSDTHMISPSFDISPDAAVKLILKPKCTGIRKGQANFRNSQGVVSVDIKFTKSASFAPKICFCVYVGDQALCGPMEHDFAKNTLCTLPKEKRHWDFQSTVKSGASSALVSLQMFCITQDHIVEG